MISRDRVRVLVGVVLTLALVGPLAWMWWGSRLPSSYAATEMGEMDYGGGPAPSQHHQHGGMQMAAGEVSVRDLDTPKDRKADVTVDLTARQGTVHLASGQKVQGYTLNGTSPGPLIEATSASWSRCGCTTSNVTDGIALHWHGVDVPNAEDGVAGITQNAVMPGQDHVYRWIAPHAGTFWYHSHQVSHEQVAGGLLAPLVIHPVKRDAGVRDVVALEHLYDAYSTMNGHVGVQSITADAGQRVRVRLINTDNGPSIAWTNVPYRLVATDGYDVVRTHRGRRKGDLDPGRRPGGPAAHRAQRRQRRTRASGGGGAGRSGRRGRTAPRPAQPAKLLDLMHYGSPASVPFDTSKPDRKFTYSIGRRPGFLNGKPGPVVERERQAPAAHADVHGAQGRRRPGEDLQPQRRRAPDAPARAPRRGGLPRRQAGHRQSVVVRQPGRAQRPRAS